MALAVQSAFTGSWSVSGSVAFPSANTAGNGLVVVAYFRGAMAGPPAPTISDSAGNAYLLLQSCGLYAPQTGDRSLLASWYVPVCNGGANTVTVQETASGSDCAIIVGALEYAGGFAGIDVATAGDTATQSTISLTFKVSAAGELVFVAGGSESHGQVLIMMDASTPGFAFEGSGQVNVAGVGGVVGEGAWDLISSKAGMQTAKLDFNPGGISGNCMLAAALSFTSAPSPPSPPPSGTLPPLSSGVWPTIF